MKSMSESYKAAGVDITAGYKAVELMKQHIAKTMAAGSIHRTSAASADCLSWTLQEWKEPVLG